MSRNDIRISTIRKITKEAKKQNKKHFQIDVQKHVDQLRTELNASIIAAAEAGCDSTHLSKEMCLDNDDMLTVYELLKQYYECLGYVVKVVLGVDLMAIYIYWNEEDIVINSEGRLDV